MTDSIAASELEPSLAGVQNHRLVLAGRPVGLVRQENFTSDAVPLPDLAEGEALMRAEYLGIDATVRTWLNSAEGYLPPVEIGEAVRCSGIGTVVASRCEKFPVGQIAYGLPGWQEYGIVRDDGMSSAIQAGADLPAMLSVLGSTGLTAYLGLTDVAEINESDTVVVSAAAGATGSVAVQIAKNVFGCRVIGICGSDEKCRWLVDDLGIDGAVNHRTDDVPARLRELCPKRIDVYFDNVGGPLLDIVLGQIARGARIALCGAIAVYNDVHKPPGPANYLNLISRRAKMQGFISLDWWDRFPAATEQLAAWVAEGKIRYRIDWHEGLKSAPDALNAMFTGANIGKIVIRL
ncbi:MAG TPA: NADP-dependent oxidoreductase [Acidimicrobiales bacterium]|jgi:NADPH-dependent curcumin reductase CurA|nr:NADP-dependent oxidoreductase [Acidimicrobiales bacterium]